MLDSGFPTEHNEYLLAENFAPSVWRFKLLQFLSRTFPFRIQEYCPSFSLVHHNIQVMEKRIEMSRCIINTAGLCTELKVAMLSLC